MNKQKQPVNIDKKSKKLSGNKSISNMDRKNNTKQSQKNKRKHHGKNTGNYYSRYNKKKFLTPQQRENKDIQDFLNKLRNNLEKRLLIENKVKIILAVSGGVDSVVMLDSLFQLAEKSEYEIIVCHFNHKLRGKSSDDDEIFVKNLSKRYGLRFYSDSGDVKTNAKKYSQSIELAARNMRYNFFERLSKSMDISFIMLAHTSDDSAETILFNLMRGTGLTGLCGIPEQRTLNKKKLIVRPMMIFKKKELIEYAELRKLKWHEDESNSLKNFTRNKIRLDLIKKIEKEYNPNFIESLNRTAKLLSYADSFIKEHLSPYLDNFKWRKKGSVLSISIQLLQSCGPFIQGEILQAKLKEKFNLGDLSLKMIDRIINLPQLEVGSIIEIGKNVIALRDRNYIVFTRRKDVVKFELDIMKEGQFETDRLIIKLSKVKKKDAVFVNDQNTELFDYDLVPAVLRLRTWEPGDYFTPLGMSGKMKISDFLINNKVSLLDKRNILVLSSRNDVLWICGMRINDKFKLTSSTSRFLKVEIIEKENTNGQQ